MPFISQCYLFLVHVLFTFYVQGVLKLKCKTPVPNVNKVRVSTNQELDVINIVKVLQVITLVSSCRRDSWYWLKQMQKNIHGYRSNTSLTTNQNFCQKMYFFFLFNCAIGTLSYWRFLKYFFKVLSVCVCVTGMRRIPTRLLGVHAATASGDDI